MAESMDTSDLLNMTLDDVIALKKAQQTKAGGGGSDGSGKARHGRRAERKQKAEPYSSLSRGDKDGGVKTNRLYVGNLSWDVTWRELKTAMQAAGHVVRADVVEDDRTGRSKGYGLVQFATAAEAANAVDTLQDLEIMGRKIFLREDREPQAAPSSTTRFTPATRNNAPTAGPPSRSGGGCSVFVNNLSWDVSWQDLKDHMRAAGQVLRADVMQDETGRSKGCGIVEYSKPYEARNAIAQLSETEFQGRTIFVREDREQDSSVRKSGGGVGSRVYVGNLEYHTAWQDLKDHMRQAGKVTYADVFQGSDGRSKGCAVVEYETAREAAAAIRDLTDTELNGRPIFVREDREEGTSAASRAPSQNTRHPHAAGLQVFIGNLPFGTSWMDLKDHCKETVGPVSFVEIPEEADGRQKGFGLVRFTNENSARDAVNLLNETEFKGRTIFCKMDNKA